MPVPFKLVRRETPAPADAALLFADGFAPLAAAVARFATPPTVHPVRGGFVLVPASGPPPAVPGAVRLRKLAGDLFVPADADLVPALLPDEAVSLTRDRGLVVLPGGDALAFDPSSPLPVGRWLAPAVVRRDRWEAFPSRPPGADRLTRIERPAPPVSAVVEGLAGGAPADAAPLGDTVPDDARPPAGRSLGERVRAGASFTAGGMLAWLGRMLNSPRLAKAGGDLARAALERVPRLSEKLLGAQEAALREVLRQLQSGDVERGLRRAPIAVADPNDAGRVGSDARLADKDPRYSLRSLVGGGGGAATAWLGGGDVWQKLADEYRRLAREAEARGDFRRAAYLHGVLLRDVRSAARALAAGGLHRDAAVLYRDKLNDPLSAAAAFDRAGDYDEAVRLYERQERYEQAGDLLRRIGDDDRAAAMYTREAAALTIRMRLLAAGDLLRTKLGDLEAAATKYREGWNLRGTDAVTCGNRLVDGYAAAGDWAAADALFDEAEENLGPPHAAEAGRFFDHALTVYRDALPADRLADLADRVRLLYAAHLRAGAADLFGRGGLWSGPVVRDATFAAKARPKAEPAVPLRRAVVRVAAGRTVAVAVARDTGDVVVATHEQVMFWRVGQGRGQLVSDDVANLSGLSTDTQGRVVYVLRRFGHGTLLRAFDVRMSRGSNPAGQYLFDPLETSEEVYYLQPEASFASDGPTVTVAGPTRREWLAGWQLLTGLGPFPPHGENTRLLVEGNGGAWEWIGDAVRCHYKRDGRDWLTRHLVPWTPDGGSAAARVDWLTPLPRVLEVAGVDAAGAVHWSEFDAREAATPASRTATACHPDGYRAACLFAPALVVAATGRNELQWLRPVSATLLPWGKSTRLDVPARVSAVVARPQSNEVVAILEDGTAVRVARP